MSDVLQRWNDLHNEVNGRVYVGAPGVRDPDSQCAEFTPGEPSGRCESDGHYLCGECRHRVEGCLACGQILARCECESCGRYGCNRPAAFFRVYPDSSIRAPLCGDHAEALVQS